METYSSQELSEIGESAPSDSIEEVIESLCQRSITEIQVNFHEQWGVLFSERFADNFYRARKNLLPPSEITQEYQAFINKEQINLLNQKEMEMEAIYQLRDYRLSNYMQDKVREIE